MATAFSGMSFWGNTARIETPATVRVGNHETAIEAICRSIARRNRPLAVANCRADVGAIDRDGNVLSRHYELTIGKPLKTGGYAVEGRVWCAVKTANA